jgi:hypothetical protein
MKPKFEFGVIMLASYFVIVEVSTFSRGKCAANYFSQDFLQDKLEVSTTLESPGSVAAIQWRGTRGGAVGSDG